MKTSSIALVAIVLLCAAFGAPAVDIPSSASADYYGQQYYCRVLPQAISATHRGLELQCTKPDNRETTGLTVGQGCPTSYFLVPLTEWGSGGITELDKAERVSWVAPDGNVLTAFGFGIRNKSTLWARVDNYTIGAKVHLVVGSFGDLIAGGGGGTSLPLEFAQTANSPAPYPGCGAATYPIFNICNVIGCPK